MFSKGDNVRDFLFDYLEDEVFPVKGSSRKGKKLLQSEQINWGSSHEGQNLLQSEQILSFVRRPQFIWKASIKMTVASPESVPIYLKLQ